jgi:DNA-binding ferritin-like protein (Dps family)
VSDSVGKELLELLRANEAVLEHALTVTHGGDLAAFCDALMRDSAVEVLRTLQDRSSRRTRSAPVPRARRARAARSH